MNEIEKAIDSLLVKTKSEIFTRIEKVSFEVDVDETNAKCYCYSLKSDGNGNLRLQDLIEFIFERILDYAIPKKDIDEAYQYSRDTNSSSKIVRLQNIARTLFTHLKKTGEGGEILLYILTLEVLKIPQLISKMSLKTNGEMHYQGSDGIHFNYDKLNGNLNLYWGESKMYAQLSTAINKCFESLNGFLNDPYSYNSTQERDISLFTKNIHDNINDPKFEKLIVEYFDKDNEKSNNLVYKGICFIGYDLKSYKELNKSKTLDDIKKEIEKGLENNHKLLSNSIKKHKLESKEIHVFLIPFPSVSEFRKEFLKTLK